MAKSKEIRDREPVEPFDRVACIRHTIATFTPQLRSISGYVNVEQRFLSDGYSTQGESFHLASVTETIEREKVTLAEHAEQVTDEGLRDMADGMRRRDTPITHTLIGRARDMGLVDTQTEPTLRRQFPGGEKLHHTFHPERIQWGIRETKAKRAVYFQPTPRQGVFAVVDLDQVYEQDPQSVKQALHDYHVTAASVELANDLLHHLRLHRPDMLDRYPDLLKALAAETDPQQRMKDIESVTRFVAYLGRVLHLTRSVEQVAKLPTTSVDMPNRGWTFVHMSLPHLAACPGGSPAIREQAGKLQGVAEALGATDFYGEGMLDAYDPDLHMLRHPDVYRRKFLDRKVAEAEKNIAMDQQLAQLVTGEKPSALTREAGIQEAEEEAPDYITLVRDLREQLGEGYMMGHFLDDIIKDAARSGLFSLSDDVTTRNVEEALLSRLRHFSYGGKIEGIVGDWERAMFTNPRLRDALVLLVLRYEEEERRKALWLESGKVYSDEQNKAEPVADFDASTSAVALREEVIFGEGALTSYNERMIKLCRDLSKELAGGVEERIKREKKEVKRLERDRKKMNTFLVGTGISEDEFVALEALAPARDDRFYDIEGSLFSILFGGLALDRAGAIDATRPVFVTLLKNLYPDVPKKTWKRLQEMIAQGKRQ